MASEMVAYISLTTFPDVDHIAFATGQKSPNDSGYHTHYRNSLLYN